MRDMTDALTDANSLRCGSIDEFAAAVQDLPVPWVLDTRCKRFSARLETRRVGAFQFSDVRFGPCRATRARGVGGRDARMCLTLQRQGRQGMFWSDRDVVLDPGDIILWDSTRPMRLENDDSARAYNFWFPTRWAEQRVGSIRDGVGVKASCATGLPKIMSRHLEMFLEEAKTLSGLQQSRLLGVVIDLISLCFSDQVLVREPVSRLGGLASAAKTHVVMAVDLDSVTPASVAAAIGTSVRSLQLAFAEEGTTFSAFVLSTRLDRARAALLSDNFAKFSITDIAHWFGFFDASHLNRAFRKKFGHSPSSFRTGTD